MASRRRLVVGVLGIALLGTCAYQCRASEPAGPPVWTAEDLPALPPEKDNGWQLLQDRLLGGLEIPTLPDDVETLVAMLDEDPPAQLWEDLAELKPALHQLIESRVGARALAVWYRSTDAPTFADACPPTIGNDCRQFQMFQLHRVAVADALWRAARGDVETGFEMATVLIERAGRYLRSARGPMGARVSVEMLETSLALAALLHHRVDEGAEVSPEVMDAYRGALESIDLDGEILEQMVVGEYLYARDALAHIQQAEGSEMFGDGLWPPRWLYDEQHAAAQIDAAYDPVMALARDAAAPIPEHEEPGWSDRLLHPVSTTLMMVLDPRILLVNQVVDVRNALSELESTRSALLRD